MTMTKNAPFKIAAILALTALVFAFGAAAQSRGLLAAGKYTAKVKSIVCDECGQRIKQAMENTQSVDSVVVDSKASAVRFQVKKAVKLGDLQSALKTAATKMGMGADYTLSDVKLAK